MPAGWDQPSLWEKWKSPCIIFPFFFIFYFWLWSFSLSWSPASSHSLNVAVMMRKRTLGWYLCSRGKAFFICISEWINSISSVSDIGKWILAVLVSTFTIDTLPSFNSEMNKPQDRASLNSGVELQVVQKLYWRNLTVFCHSANRYRVIFMFSPQIQNFRFCMPVPGCW